MAIVYDVGFRVDTRAIERELRVINSEIAKITKEGGNRMTKELAEGIRQANILKDVLSKATTEKGTSFVTMNNQLKAAGTNAERMATALTNAKLNESLNLFSSTFATADRNLLAMNAKLREAAHIMRQSTLYASAHGIYRFFGEQVQASTRWVRDLDRALRDIAIVAPEAAGRMEEVGRRILDGARDLKVAAREYAQASIIFYQQGLDIDEVDRRTRITVKAARVAGQSVVAMSEQLTAIWNTYQMQGDQLERAASIAAKLGAETAASFEDIAAGMQIAAAGASLMGVSYESLASIISTVRETTLQSSSTIGNAYKTIFARFTNLKTSGEDAGQSLGVVTQALNHLGINVLDQTGNLRELDDIILQIGTSWGSYSRKQQIAIAQVVGGTRQYQQFLALMQNFDKYQKNLLSATSETSAAELERQYAEALDSIDTQVTKSAEAWRRALSDIFSADAQKGFYYGLEKIANLLDGIIDSFGGINGLIGFGAAILLNRAVPAFTSFKNAATTWVANLTPEGQQKAIASEYAHRRSAAEFLLGPNASKEELIKLRTEEKLAQAAALTHTAMRSKDEKTRITAEANLKLLERQTEMNRLVAEGYAETTRELHEQIEAVNVHRKNTEAYNQRMRGNLGQTRKAAQDAADDNAFAQEVVRLAQEDRPIESTPRLRELEDLKAASQAAAQAAREEIKKAEEMNKEKRGSGRGAKEYWKGEKAKHLREVQIYNAQIKRQKELIKERNRLVKENVKELQKEADKMKEVADRTQEAYQKELARTKHRRSRQVGTTQLEKLMGFVAGLEADSLTGGSVQEITDSAKQRLEKLVGYFGKRGAEPLANILRRPLRASDATVVDYAEVVTQAMGEVLGRTKFDPRKTDHHRYLPAAQEAAERIGFNLQEREAAEMALRRSKELLDSENSSLRANAQAYGTAASGALLYTQAMYNFIDAAQSGNLSLSSLVGTVFQLGPAFGLMRSGLDKVSASLYRTSAAQSIFSSSAALASAMMGGVMIALTAASAVAATIVKRNRELEQTVSRTAKTSETLQEVTKQISGMSVELSNLNKQFQDGAVSTSEYNKQLQKLSTTLQQISKDNPSIAGVIDYEAFSFASAAERQNMLKDIEKELLKSQQVQGSIAEEAFLKRHGSGVFASTFGDGKISDVISKYAGNRYGYTSFHRIAENYSRILGELEDEEEAVFIKTLNRFEGFADYLATKQRGLVAGVREDYLELSKELTSEKSVISYLAKITGNKDEVTKTVAEAEAAYQAALEKVRATLSDTYAAYGPKAQAESEANAAHAALLAARKQAGDSVKLYEETVKQAYQSLDEPASKLIVKTHEAFLVLARARDDIEEKFEDFHKVTEEELLEAMRLIDAGMTSLVGSTDKVAVATASLSAAFEQAAPAFDKFIKADNAQKKISALEDINEQIALMNKLLGVLGEAEISPLAASLLGLDIGTQNSFARGIQNEIEARSLEALVSIRSGSEQEQLTRTIKISEARSKLLSTLRHSLKENEGNAGAQQSAIDHFNNMLSILGEGEMSKITDEFLNLTSAQQEQRLAELALAETSNNLAKAKLALAGSLDKTSAEGKLVRNVVQGLQKDILAHKATVDKLDYDKVESLASYFQDAAADSKDLADALEQNRIAAEDVSREILKMERAAEIVQKNRETWIEILAQETEGSATYAETILSIRGALADMLNVSPDDVPTTFARSEEALNLLREAADGSTDALRKLERAYLDSVVQGMDESISSHARAVFDILALDADFRAEIGRDYVVGEIQSPRVQGFIDAMNEMLRAGQIAKDEVERIMAALNFTVTFEKSTTDTRHRTKNPGRLGGPQEFIEDVGASDFLQIHKLTVGSSNAPRISGSKKGRKGGGSKADHSTQRKDYGQRYLDTNAALAVLTRSLERVSTAEDKAFGIQKLELLNRKNKLLQEQARHYQTLEKEARNYLRTNAGKLTEFGNGYIGAAGGDQGVLQVMLRQLGIGPAVFNSDGYVANSEGILKALDASATSKLKSLGAVYKENVWQFGANKKAEEAYKRHEKMLDKVKEQIELVDATAARVDDFRKRQLENVHNWLSNKLKEVNYRLELKMTVNANDMKQLDFLMKRLGERAKQLQIDNLWDQTRISLKDSEALLSTFDRLQKIISNIQGSTAKDKSWFEQTFGKGAWTEFMNNGGALTAEMMQTLQDKSEKMQAVIEQLYDQSDKMFSKFHEALQLYLKDFDNLAAQFDRNADILKSWETIWDIAGQGWANQRVALDITNKQIDTQNHKVQGLSKKYDLLQRSIAGAEQTYKDAVRAHGENDAIAQRAKEQLEELKRQAAEARANLMKEVAATLEMIKDSAEKTAVVIVHEFDRALRGAFADMSSSMDMYGQKKGIDSFFLNGEDAGFEINKMLKDMKKSMEGVTDPELLNKHRQWENHLNSLIEKRKVLTEHMGQMKEEEITVTKNGVKLTQTQLDILKAEFELEKAKAAFKDQQKMKNTMRLARDASGNWSYIYSSDGEAQDDKGIEEKLNNIRKMHRQAADEGAEAWLRIANEFRNYIAGVDQQRYQQDEKYRAEVDQRKRWYQEQMDLYSNQIQHHNNAIGRSFSEMSLSVIVDMDNMENANNRYKESSNQLFEALNKNHRDHQRLAKEALEAVGISYDRLRQEVAQAGANITSDNARLQQSLHELSRGAALSLDSMVQNATRWADSWVSQTQRVIDAMRAAQQAINDHYRNRAGEGEYFNSNTDYTSELQKAQREGASEDVMRQLARERYYKIQAALETKFNIGRNRAANPNGAWKSQVAKWLLDSGEEIYKDGMSLEDFIERTLRKYGRGYLSGGLATGRQLAWLSEDNRPELILNSEDTRNILSAVNIVRAGIATFLQDVGSNQQHLLAAAGLPDLQGEAGAGNIIINADFPNVTAREEIEAAFVSLKNDAAQYRIKSRQ